MRTVKKSSGISWAWLLTVALAIVPGTMRVHAHVGDVVYPFIEITDEMLEEFDLSDGSIEDWEVVLGEPTLNQYYSAVPEAPAGLHVALGDYDGADWMDQPPYAEGGGAARGENPTVWVVEFAITPFDLMLQDDPEASVASNLRPGMIVGFNIGVNDLDTEPEDWGEFYNLFWPTDFTPSGLGDGLLLDAAGGSVVESVSWARIKATLRD